MANNAVQSDEFLKCALSAKDDDDRRICLGMATCWLRPENAQRAAAQAQTVRVPRPGSCASLLASSHSISARFEEGACVIGSSWAPGIRFCGSSK